MLGINKITLLGHVGQDPDVRTFDNGSSVANVSLATSERWKDKQTGDRREATEWHRLVFYGALVDVVEQYVRKGAPLYVEGKVKTREYEKDGQKHRITEVIVSELRLLGDRPDQQQSQQQAAPARQQSNGARGGQQQSRGRPAPQQNDYPFNDDIPF